MRTMILAFAAAALAGGAYAQPVNTAAVTARENDPGYQQFEQKLRADLDARIAERNGGARTGLATDVAFQGLSPNESSQDAANRGQGIVPPRTGGTSSRALDTYPNGAPRSNLPDWATQPVARTGLPAPAAATAPASLSPHQQACAAKYKSYDPASDLYVSRPGVKERCTITVATPKVPY